MDVENIQLDRSHTVPVNSHPCIEVATKPQAPKTNNTIESSASEDASCCLIYVLSYLKEKVVCFFKWLCSCLTASKPSLEEEPLAEEIPATEEEKKAIKSDLQGITGSLIDVINQRYNSTKELDHRSELVPCILADSFKILPSIKEMHIICETLIQRSEDETDLLTKREIQLRKKEISQLAKKVIQLTKRPVNPVLSTEMEESIRDFSLEKLHFCDQPESGQESIKFAFTVFRKTSNYLLDDIVKYVNKIRIDNMMDVVKEIF